MVMAVATPLGLSPRASPGCNVAATRCLARGAGGANAVPPPRFLRNGWAARCPGASAARCAVLLRVRLGLFLQEVLHSPLRRPLSAMALDRCLRGVLIVVQCLRHHHTGVVRRCSCPSGGTCSSLAAARQPWPRIILWNLEWSCFIGCGNKGCCSGH